MTVQVIRSFFDVNYKTPLWLKEKRFKEKKLKEKGLKEKSLKAKALKENSLNNKLSRRTLLKSAAGASAIASLPGKSWAISSAAQLDLALKTDPWLTLNAVLDHLLPASASGPGAREINALPYLYNVVIQQPTEQAEIDFIFKGVGWLNDFSQSQKNSNFVSQSSEDKETLLRAISGSRAGENWLSTLMSYIFEAMLSPPAYGGNPDGIGWKWLEHQPGFPLPKAGKRYYELPGQQSIAVNVLTSKGTKKA